MTEPLTKPNFATRCEKWRSSEAREEIHYFIEGTQTYLIGFNPQIIPESAMARLLKELGYE